VYVVLKFLSHMLRITRKISGYPASNTLRTIKLRMHEENQTELSHYWGVSCSRISEYLSGNSEPTLKITWGISRKLNVEASFV
jgi:HTH-type transcriptional regulator / antitoxin HigA